MTILLKRYWILLFTIPFVITYKAGAQNIKELTVGDKVPNLELNNIINFSTTKVDLADFKNKLVIIDFWGTTCSSCIGALPKIDSMQQLFKNEIQVLTVSDFGTKEQVEKVFLRFKKLRHTTLPVVLNNSKLKKLFPHQLVSHVVWIGRDGIVKAITGTEYITKQNIETILQGKKINWPLKKDVYEFDYNKPLLDFSNIGQIQTEFIYSSVFAGYIDGIDATDKLIFDSTKGTVTRNHFNHRLIQLCDGALTGHGTGYIDSKHLVLRVKDKNRYIQGNSYYAEWAKKNTYSYSYTLPIGLTKEEESDFVKKDLAHWLDVLGISVKKEKLLTKCLLLVRTSKDETLIKTKGGEYEYGLNETGKVKWLNNSGFKNFIWYLNEETEDIPWVIDETGIDFKVDMEFHLDSFQNIPALRNDLQRYGLDLVEAKRELEVYIITEKDLK